jgi:hypothetical protein
LEEQIRIRQKQAVTRAESVNDIIVREGAIGELAGIMLALGLPEMLLSGITEEIEELQLELIKENDDEDS